MRHKRIGIALDLSKSLGDVVVLLGIAVLIGWSIDSEPLKRLLPGFVSMNPLTAACFIAMGAALRLSRSHSQLARFASITLAIAALAASAWKLLADAEVTSIHPDSIMFTQAVKEDFSRMAPSTALGFALAAASLLLLQSERKSLRISGQYLALSLGFVALFAAVGYIYGAGTVRTIGPFAMMALHTSWGLLLLAIGLLFKDTRTGLMALVVSGGAAGRLLRLMIPAVIVVPTVLGWMSVVGDRVGLFGTPLALTLLSTSSMILLFFLTFVTAEMIQGKDQERHRRLEIVRASEERLAGILSIAADAIISVDANQRITLFNTWAEKLFGYSSKEVLGRRLEILLPERFRAAHGGYVEGFGAGTVKARRMGERGEILARRKDGSTFPAEASISKISVEGQLIYTVVLRDMTERWRAEEALTRAKEGAEAAARSKSEFLANMSHEIRTPLNSISGFTQLLLADKSLDGSVREKVAKIGRSAEALTTIVNDILDYSKLEEGMLTLSMVPLSPLKLVQNCISMVETVSEAKRLPIRVVAPQELRGRSYLGDPHRLQQILLNLLGNAVKFTTKGGITVKVIEEDADDDAAWLYFAVTDTGIGIPAERMGRLFHRFSQVDGSVSRHYGGTGLGLAICKRLVTLMGGKIGADSEAGKGSTFWFRLPMERTSVPVARNGETASEGPRHGTKRSILVVEDIELNREIAVAMIEQAGHSVEVACDGAEAVQMVRKKRYDLILMDIQMPTMDGITATQQIRAIAGDNGSVPIVAMTANVLPDEVSKFRAAGMNGHIRKPIDRAELIAGVDRWAAANDRAVA